MTRIALVTLGLAALVACGGGGEPAADAATSDAPPANPANPEAPPPKPKVEVKPRALLAFNKGDKNAAWNFAIEDLKTACTRWGVKIQEIEPTLEEVEVEADWKVPVQEILADHDKGFIAAEKEKTPVYLPFKPAVSTLASLDKLFTVGCKDPNAPEPKPEPEEGHEGEAH